MHILFNSQYRNLINGPYSLVICMIVLMFVLSLLLSPSPWIYDPERIKATWSVILVRPFPDISKDLMYSHYIKWMHIEQTQVDVSYISQPNCSQNKPLKSKQNLCFSNYFIQGEKLGKLFGSYFVSRTSQDYSVIMITTNLVTEKIIISLGSHL